MSGPVEAGGADTAIRSGSTSFALASGLFDPTTRLRVWLLYAWCRHCDDVTDGQVLGHGARLVGDRASRAVELRRLSLQALDGDGSGGPPFAGLARVAAETGLPRRYVEDHLAGFEMDAAGRRYDTFEDTLCYGYHVAGVVGLMMAWIMGVRDNDTLLRGCDLGIAFQLTNIARDVNDDAVNGRVYLPAAWLHQVGVALTPGASLDRGARAAIVPLVARLLDEADRYYASAGYGITRLPWRSACAVATARHVYADIGRGVRRRGAHAWDARVSTTKRRKLLRLVQAIGETGWTRVTSKWMKAPARQGLWTPPSPSVLG
jgi:phytoene synthase